MKIGMVSLGCPKNLVDSEVMLGLAQKEGHRLTRDAAEADVLVVNTCAFASTFTDSVRPPTFNIAFVRTTWLFATSTPLALNVALPSWWRVPEAGCSSPTCCCVVCDSVT